VLVHTGQSYDYNMSGIFFNEFSIRPPDYYLEVKSDTTFEQIGKIFTGIERVLDKEKPDRMLILGDTNSALAAYVAKRKGIPVYHMEAGNRCYSDKVPEEVNRRMIDQCSDILMPYTERSRQNLLAEHFPSNKIFVTGNPIWEVINNFKETNVLDSLFNVSPHNYFLVTAHRQENVEDNDRLRLLILAIVELGRNYNLPVVFSCHPRTRQRINTLCIDTDGIILHDPFGMLDFLTLEHNATCVLSDSGTIQEETCLLRVPSVTIRDVTERPETVECGSNIISGVMPEDIFRCVEVALSMGTDWDVPVEYLKYNVSDTVVKIICSY
jgi:UDP-N-acetylglucosamine 2-epimerase (non-hydrolysing)